MILIDTFEERNTDTEEKDSTRRLQRPQKRGEEEIKRRNRKTTQSLGGNLGKSGNEANREYEKKEE